MSEINIFLTREIHLGKETFDILANMSDYNYRSMENLRNQFISLGANMSSMLLDLQSKSGEKFYNSYVLTAVNSELFSIEQYRQSLVDLLKALNLLNTSRLA